MTQPFLPTRWVIAASDQVDDADVFPFLAGQSFLVRKSPLWSTKQDISVSGVSRRRALWSYPIWQFRLGYEVLRDATAFLELQRLVTFFNSKSGSQTGFFYFDRFDHQVTSGPLGTGDGTTTTFQAQRNTSIGNIAFTEPVFGFNGNPTVYDNGTATTAFTVGQLGQITFTTAPASGHTLTWSGSFFFLCNFDKDSLDGLGQIGSGLWNLSSLDFRSFKA